MKKRRTGLLRQVLQFSVLGLIIFLFVVAQLGLGVFNFEQYCPMGGIQSLVTLAQDDLLACNMTAAQLTMGAIFLFAVLTLGKLFCGYLCPLGTISETVGKLGARFSLRKDINGIPDKLLRSFKYILLFATLTITLKTGELFCKQYDPFYATVTLYGHRVDYLYATIAISVFLLGSFIFRLFWCKYMCPLGAISNIFKYWLGVGIVILLLGAVYFFELNIDIAYVIGAICLTGYFLEIFKVDTKRQSFLKITRHADACTSCGLCSRRCPQGIDVAGMEEVTHPDCNMCTECVSVCRKKGALTVNDKLNFKWIPAIITVVLLLVGMFLGEHFDLPTVSKTWGSEEEMTKSKTARIDHISQLTCYSSSMGFVRQMKEVDGILGVSTFISDHEAEITYDTTRTSELAIRKMLYKRSKQFIQQPPLEQPLVVHKLTIAQHLTPADLLLIAKAISKNKVFQLETQFDTKIRMLAFCDPSITEEAISSLVSGVLNADDQPYQVTEVVKSPRGISGRGLMRRTFKAYLKTFNNIKSYNKEQIKSVIFDIRKFPKNESHFDLLANHLGKKFIGVVGIESKFEHKPFAKFYYIEGKVKPEEILEWANQKQLTLTYTNGSTELVHNPYLFKTN